MSKCNISLKSHTSAKKRNLNFMVTFMVYKFRKIDRKIDFRNNKKTMSLAKKQQHKNKKKKTTTKNKQTKKQTNIQHGYFAVKLHVSYDW